MSHRRLNPRGKQLSSETVWDAFWIYGLLLWQTSTKDIPLSLPHKGSNRDRFNKALSARNDDMLSCGQALWSHTCDKCEKIEYSAPTDGSDPIPISRCLRCTYFYA